MCLFKKVYSVCSLVSKELHLVEVLCVKVEMLLGGVGARVVVVEWEEEINKLCPSQTITP